MPAELLSFLEGTRTVPLPGDEQDLGSEKHAYVVGEDGEAHPAGVDGRLANCGALRHRCSPLTGEWHGYYQDCGLYLYCPRCLARRIGKEKMQLELATGRKKRVTVTESEAKDLVKTLKSGQYRRFPREDGMIEIIHTAEGGPGEWINDLDGLDWDAIGKTPKGKNISGKLGQYAAIAVKEEKGEEEEERGPSKLVTVKSIVVQAPPGSKGETQRRDDYRKCWERATLHTAHIDVDLETLHLAMTERMELYEANLAERGYRTRFFVYEMTRVWERDIDWSGYNLHIRKKYAEQGIYNENLPKEVPESVPEEEPMSTYDAIFAALTDDEPGDEPAVLEFEAPPGQKPVKRALYTDAYLAERIKRITQEEERKPGGVSRLKAFAVNLERLRRGEMTLDEERMETMHDRPKASAASPGDYEQYVEQAIESELDILRDTPEGGRNTALFQTARALASLAMSPWAGLDWKDVEADLVSVGVGLGLPEQEAGAAVRRGPKYAEARPEPDDDCEPGDFFPSLRTARNELAREEERDYEEFGGCPF